MVSVMKRLPYEYKNSRGFKYFSIASFTFSFVMIVGLMFMQTVPVASVETVLTLTFDECIEIALKENPATFSITKRISQSPG